jgi:hypothetical protein
VKVADGLGDVAGGPFRATTIAAALLPVLPFNGIGYQQAGRKGCFGLFFVETSRYKAAIPQHRELFDG